MQKSILRFQLPLVDCNRNRFTILPEIFVVCQNSVRKFFGPKL
jgi:hypothetical protein